MMSYSPHVERFFRRVSSGQFELPDADALWRLMCAITLTKARRAARDHSRQKRGIANEQYLDASPTDSVGKQIELPGNQQTPLDRCRVFRSDGQASF